MSQVEIEIECLKICTYIVQVAMFTILLLKQKQTPSTAVPL